jgi:acyl carrier protein
MGLDSVELVMAVEEGFGVTFSDADAASCLTPAMLIDSVVAKIQMSEERSCVPQRAFYLLRKISIKILGVSRKSIIPEADFRRLLDGKNQKDVWRELKAELQARSWPLLERPGWMKTALMVSTLVIFGAGWFYFGWILATIFSVLFAVVSERLTRRYKNCIPSRRSTFRALVPFAMTSNLISWTREQVALSVRKIVIEQLALKEGQYREDANFVKDLGMD